MKAAWICVMGLLFCSAMLDAAQVGPNVERELAKAPVRVLVLLHDSSDKTASDSRKIADLKALRADVIDGIDDAHLQMRREFSLLPAFAAEIDAQALAQLRAHPAVRRIDLDSGGSGSMFEARPLAKIDAVNGLGLTGAGQTIAVIDSGIARNHLDFSGRIVAEQCFCSSSSGGGGCCPNGSATQSGVGSANDDNGHGTNVTGIAAAGGAISMRGAAPAANIVAVKVIDSNNRFCCTSDVLAALDWVKVNYPDAKTVNASLGTSLLLPGDCDNASSLTIAGANAIQQLANNGTMVFASAGNQANANAMSIPACLSGVVGVGAVWDRDFPSATALGCTDTAVLPATPTCFSNSSAGTDLYAPGAFTTSSGRTGGQSTYAGTSQASPLVAGCASLLRAAHPNASLQQIRAALFASPTRVTDAKNGRNFPLLDCADALSKLGGEGSQNHHLAVSKIGSGGGTVTSSPAGIDCGATCSANFASGTVVALSAAAAGGSAFVGWAGCDSTSGASCSVTMNAARNVSATFNLSGGGGTVLQNGVPLSNLSGAQLSSSAFTVVVPSGAQNLVIRTSGGSGDPDLYVRFGAPATTATFNCRSTSNTPTEQCTFAVPSAGTHHILIYGFGAYSGLTLTASWQTAGGTLAEPVAVVNLPLTTGTACAAFYSVKTFGNPGIVPGVTATEITLEGNDRRLVGGLIMKGNVLRSGAFAGVTVPATPGRAVQLAPIAFWLPPDLGAATLEVVTGNTTLSSVRLPARSGAQVIPPILLGDRGGFFSVRLTPDTLAQFGDRPFAIELGVKFLDNTSAFFDSGTVVGGVIDGNNPTEVSFCMAISQNVKIRTLGFPTYGDGVTGQYFTIRNPQDVVVFDSRNP